jgi:hypothetical protein
MRGLLTLALLLPLVFGSGCFVFDELDKGKEIMDAHTPAAKKKKDEAEAAKAAAGNGEAPPTYDQLTQKWWKDASSLSKAPDEEDGEAPDPNATVSCQHDGKTFYTRRSDCLARGGRTG